MDYTDLFIYDEAQQEAALSDLAILGALPRKCLVLRLGDPKQTSGGTGPSDLARRVRLVSDQLALGIHVGDAILSATFRSKIHAFFGFTFSLSCSPTWQTMRPRRQRQT